LPHSHELSAEGFLLWGYRKAAVFMKTHPASIPDLKQWSQQCLTAHYDLCTWSKTSAKVMMVAM